MQAHSFRARARERERTKDERDENDEKDKGIHLVFLAVGIEFTITEFCSSIYRSLNCPFRRFSSFSSFVLFSLTGTGTEKKHKFSTFLV